MLLALVAIPLMFILVIGVHEAGHALAAYVLGVQVKRVSIGFGKPILSWNRKGCEWAWGWIPLGGRVTLLNSRAFPVDEQQYPHCFDKQAVWRRIVILLAGSFANLLMAWLALVLVFLSGLPYSLPLVASVEKGSVAWKAGMTSGDQFLAINGQSTAGWREVGMQVISLWGKKRVWVQCKQANGLERTLSLDLSLVRFSRQNHSLLAVLGINPERHAGKGLLKAESLVGAVEQANQSLRRELWFFVVIIKQVLSGTLPFFALLGPLGLLALTLSSFGQGLVVFLYFIAILSLAVALVNSLPIPALDGGSIVYALLEKCRGKPISPAWEQLIHRLASIALWLLLIQLLLNDFARVLAPGHT